MNTVGKVALGCGGLFVLFFVSIFGIVFFATSGITDTADDFFEAASEGNYAAAHNLTAQQLRSSSDPAQLEQFLNINGLNEVTGSSWNSRSIDNGTGRLEGSVTTASGSTIPLALEFVSENDEWKISFIDTQVGMSGGPAGGSASSDE